MNSKRYSATIMLFILLLGSLQAQQSKATYTQVVNKADIPAGQITVLSSKNPSPFSTSVTFTAAVPSTATGMVHFFDGRANEIGSGSTIASGSATVTTSSLSVGAHAITAVYPGDQNFNSATSAALAQTVNKGDAGLALDAAPNPSTFGASVTLTANLNFLVTGSIDFFDGTAKIGSGTITAGKATLTLSTFTAGSHSLTAQFAGDVNFSVGTSNAISLTVGKASPSTTLASSKNPSTAADSVTFTATVPSDATGTITFLDGSTTIGGVQNVSAGEASVAIQLTTGVHPITATYSGDANYQGKTSPSVSQVVSKGPVGLTLGVAPNPSTFDVSVTLTATLNSLASGGIDFFDGATKIGSATINAGKATLILSTFTAGSHALTAQFVGDVNFDASTSGAVVLAVNKASPVNTLASSKNPSNFNDAVTLAAIVPSDATGTVTFFDGSTQIGAPQTVAAGGASITISTLIAGTHSLTAVYSGDSNYLSATSAVLAQTIDKSSTAGAVTLVSDANPADFSSTVKFTASVPLNATGTVDFLDGATKIGTSSVSGGKATLSVSTISVGSHPITAAYSGDSNFLSGTSAVLNETINKAAVNMTISGAPNPSKFGDAVTITIQVTGFNNVIPTGTVALDEGGATLGTVAVDAAGRATITISTLSAGSHGITATYSGDSNYR